MRTGKKRTLQHELIALVEGAREMCVISSFLLSSRKLEKAMLAAAARGVRIYVMTASEQRLLSDPTNEFDQQRLDEHKDMLFALAGHVLVRSFAGFHAKCLLVDPGTEPRGVLLTGNVIEEALQRSQDLGIVLGADEVQGAFAALRHGFWEMARFELRAGGQVAGVSPQGAVLSADPAPMVSNSPLSVSLDQALLDVLEEPAGDVMAASFRWDLSHPVTTRLVELAEQGVRVTVLARPDVGPSQESLAALASAGALVLGTERMHAKILLTPRAGVVHTANYARYATEVGHESLELGVRCHDERLAAVRKIADGWATMASSAVDGPAIR
jgi:cardiolipin synthase